MNNKVTGLLLKAGYKYLLYVTGSEKNRHNQASLNLTIKHEIQWVKYYSLKTKNVICLSILFLVNKGANNNNLEISSYLPTQ